MAARNKGSMDANAFRATHQRTVDAILGAQKSREGIWNEDYRAVRSQGSAFYNRDHWTLRAFTAAMVEWLERNKNARPTKDDVANWVSVANRRQFYDRPSIVIAKTPAHLKKWVALALIGGGYHEAWHTVYSRRDYLSLDEVWPHIDRLIDLADWSGMTGPLLSWSNIVEDIYIERKGCRDYPGAGDKMVALQDLILRQEEEGSLQAEAMGHKALPESKALAAVTGAFRDLGLGYKSSRQQAALAKYKADSPQGWDLVTKGKLAPLVQASIDLADHNPGKLGSLWVAMEVLAIIGPPPKPPQQDPGENGEGGESQPGAGQPQEGSGQGQPDKRPTAYNVGDRAILKTGEHAGREVEITWAGVQCPEGKQELMFALVEEV